MGWTAELSTLQHDVAGTATIVDDCTVEITMFDYDGRGIDVRVYGGPNGNYDPPAGFPMGPDLVRTTPYVSETIVAKVPGGRTLTEVDGVSIWCVDVSVDFGSGQFAPP